MCMYVPFAGKGLSEMIYTVLGGSLIPTHSLNMNSITAAPGQIRGDMVSIVTTFHCNSQDLLLPKQFDCFVYIKHIKHMLHLFTRHHT